VAVAGFGKQDVKIEVKENTLSIRGEKKRSEQGTRVPPPRHRIPGLLILIAASREPSSPGDHWRCTTISASDLIVAALPGFILGFLGGGLLGPKVDPG
jgi:hypothetical protein